MKGTWGWFIVRCVLLLGLIGYLGHGALTSDSGATRWLWPAAFAAVLLNDVRLTLGARWSKRDACEHEREAVELAAEKLHVMRLRLAAAAPTTEDAAPAFPSPDGPLESRG